MGSLVFIVKVANEGTDSEVLGAEIVIALLPDLRAVAVCMVRMGGGAIMAARGSADIVGVEAERFGGAIMAARGSFPPPGALSP